MSVGLEIRTLSGKNPFRVSDDLEQALGRLLGESRLLHYNKELDQGQAKGCLSCLLRELALPREEAEAGTFDLRIGNLDDYVRLDSSAAEAINLLPSADQDTSTEYGSIFHILNRYSFT